MHDIHGTITPTHIPESKSTSSIMLTVPVLPVVAVDTEDSLRGLPDERDAPNPDVVDSKITVDPEAHDPVNKTSGTTDSPGIQALECEAECGVSDLNRVADGRCSSNAKSYSSERVVAVSTEYGRSVSDVLPDRGRLQTAVVVRGRLVTRVLDLVNPSARYLKFPIR